MREVPQFLNERGEIRATKNRLPHWEQDGCTYFITFRLGDSLPQRLLDGWKEERRIWLELHPEPWSEMDEAEYHKRFSGARERWLDAGYGECLLKRSDIRSILVGSLEKQVCVLWSFVIMPNHVHLLVSLSAEVELPMLMQQIKGGSSFEMNQALGRSGPLWAKDYFDRLVRDQSHFFNCAGYIRRNPLRAKLREECFTLVESEYVRRMLDGG